MTRPENQESRNMNSDPITGKAGAHPLSTGLGATSGAVAGIAAGAIAGPLGMALGGVVGAVVGGLVGKGAGEEWNPTAEELYSSRAHNEPPYHNEAMTFDDYAPAYRAGYLHRIEHSDAPWDLAESDLCLDWDRIKGGSRLCWGDARHAAQAAWNRAAGAASEHEAVNSDV